MTAEEDKFNHQALTTEVRICYTGLMVHGVNGSAQ
jgi:hypothetical protein